MTNQFAQTLLAPLDAVIFDCDSTLSQIEGITLLAEQNNVLDEVEFLTEQAMNETGINIHLYHQRLALVRPSFKQVMATARDYWQHRSPDSIQVIKILQRLGKKVYVLSAGIQQAVEAFAKQYAIPADHVFAVTLFFDQQGNYRDFDHQSSLCQTRGKREAVLSLRNQHQSMALIGDGMNDLEAVDAVERFIGYGGAAYRQSIADQCQYYLSHRSFLPLLPLLLSEQDISLLTDEEKLEYQKGLELLEK